MRKLSQQELDKLWINIEYVSGLLAQVDMNIQQLQANINQLAGWVEPRFQVTLATTAEWLREYFQKAVQEANDVVSLIEQGPSIQEEDSARMWEPLGESPGVPWMG